MLHEVLGTLQKQRFSISRFHETVETLSGRKEEHKAFVYENEHMFDVLFLGDDEHYSVFECFEKLLNCSSTKNTSVKLILSLLELVFRVPEAVGESSLEFVIASCSKLAISLPPSRVEDFIGTVQSLKPAVQTVERAVQNILREIKFSHRKEYKGLGIVLYSSFLLSISTDEVTKSQGREILLKRLPDPLLSASTQSDLCLAIRSISYLIDGEEERTTRRRLFGEVLSVLYDSDRRSNSKVMDSVLWCLRQNHDSFHSCHMLRSTEHLERTLDCLEHLSNLKCSGRSQESERINANRSAVHSILTSIVEHEAASFVTSRKKSMTSAVEVTVSRAVSTLRTSCGTPTACRALVTLSCLPPQLLRDTSLVPLEASDVFETIDRLSTTLENPQLTRNHLAHCLIVYVYLLTRGEQFRWRADEMETITSYTIPLCIQHGSIGSERLGSVLVELYQRISLRDSKLFVSFIHSLTPDHLEYAVEVWAAMYNKLDSNAQQSLSRNTIKTILKCLEVSDSSTYDENVGSYKSTIVKFVSELGTRVGSNVLAPVSIRFSSILMRLLKRMWLSHEDEHFLRSLTKWAIDNPSTILEEKQLIEVLTNHVAVSRGSDSKSCVRLVFCLLDGLRSSEKGNWRLSIILRKPGLVEALTAAATVSNMRLVIGFLSMPGSSDLVERVVPQLKEFLRRGESGELSIVNEEEWLVARDAVLRVLARVPRAPQERSEETDSRLVPFPHGDFKLFMDGRSLKEPTALRVVLQRMLTAMKREEWTVISSFLHSLAVQTSLPEECSESLGNFFKQCIRSARMKDSMVFLCVETLLTLSVTSDVVLSLLPPVLRTILPRQGREPEPPFYNDRLRKFGPVFLSFLGTLSGENVLRFAVLVHEFHDSIQHLPGNTNNHDDVINIILQLSTQPEYETLFPASRFLSAKMDLEERKESTCDFDVPIPDILSEESINWSSLTDQQWLRIMKEVPILLQTESTVEWCRSMLMSLPFSISIESSEMDSFFSSICEHWPTIWKDNCTTDDALTALEGMLDLEMSSLHLNDDDIRAIFDWMKGLLEKKPTAGLVTRLVSCSSRIFRHHSNNYHQTAFIDCLIDLLKKKNTLGTQSVIQSLFVACAAAGVYSVMRLLPVMSTTPMTTPQLLSWFKRLTPEYQYEFTGRVWKDCTSVQFIGCRQEFSLEFYVNSVLLPCLSLISHHNQKELLTFTLDVWNFAKQQCAIGFRTVECELMWMRVLDALLGKIVRRLVNCLVEKKVPVGLSPTRDCQLCLCTSSELPHAEWKDMKKLIVFRCRQNLFRKVSPDEDPILSIHSLCLIVSIARVWPECRGSQLNVAFPTFGQLHEAVPADQWPIAVYKQKFQSAGGSAVTSTDTDMIAQSDYDEVSTATDITMYDVYVERMASLIRRELRIVGNTVVEEIPNWMTNMLEILTNVSIADKMVNMKLLVLSIIIKLKWHNCLSPLVVPAWQCAQILDGQRLGNSPAGNKKEEKKEPVTSVAAICLSLVDTFIEWSGQDKSDHVKSCVGSRVLSFLQHRLSSGKAHNKTAVANSLERARGAWEPKEMEEFMEADFQQPSYSGLDSDLFGTALAVIAEWEREEQNELQTTMNRTVLDTCATMVDTMPELVSEEDEKEGEEEVDERQQEPTAHSTDLTELSPIDYLKYVRQRVREKDIVLSLSILLSSNLSREEKKEWANRVLASSKYTVFLQPVVSLILHFSVPVDVSFLPLILTRGEKGARYLREMISTEQFDTDLFVLEENGTQSVRDMSSMLKQYENLVDGSFWRANSVCSNPVNTALLPATQIRNRIQKVQMDGSLKRDSLDSEVSLPVAICDLLHNRQWEAAYFAAEQLAALLSRRECSNAYCLVNFGVAWRNCVSFYVLIMDPLNSLDPQLMGSIDLRQLINTDTN